MAKRFSPMRPLTPGEARQASLPGAEYVRLPADKTKPAVERPEFRPKAEQEPDLALRPYFVLRGENGRARGFLMPTAGGGARRTSAAYLNGKVIRLPGGRVPPGMRGPKPPRKGVPV